MRRAILSLLVVAVILAGVGVVAAADGGTGRAPRTAEASLARVTPAAAVRTADPAARSARAARVLPLHGIVIGVDPGHNGRNGDDPSYIDRQIWNGREYENCNTTGTSTDFGFTEAQFNWDVATDLVRDLVAEGARVVLTRHSNDGVGPCVNRRAAIMNDAHVAVAVAIHADGAPADGHGFTVLEPVADGINNRAIAPSLRFARLLRAAFTSGTGMPVSTYDGVDGLQPRDNLAGENLTKVPYALIECGNMRNAGDASLQTSAVWRARAAAAIARAITQFVRSR